MRLRIGERREASLAREGRYTLRLRILFYGAAARLRFRTTKTHSRPRLYRRIALQCRHIDCRLRGCRRGREQGGGCYRTRPMPHG